MIAGTTQGAKFVQGEATAAEIIRPEGKASVVLVCEHASNAIPAEYGDLGLDAAARTSHVAWDIGARDVAVALSELLDAPLVAGRLSRLLYDLNRPCEVASAVPETSEVFDVPGNRGLSEAQRLARCRDIHDPFHAALTRQVDRAVAQAPGPVRLVTVHSFTPVYMGRERAVEIGFLHDADDSLARAALEVETRKGAYVTALNEPYSAADGVTYTLAKHGEARGLTSLMIEIRNDLVATPEQARAMARHLADTLRSALSGAPARREATG
ncbi:N-formylglutamate amidohydrolase family protein [Pseudooceanicola batsensis HTCC2597]|uniref:N-formylglutamate amidohydrolase family protein n=1 Tax=Pseudooceanicola batsensis (strain ATCC BAA-863 / DSM 15984 / KCTC 12145 / HTCC2597) TaxID=252305 RepID=A3TUS4_PSEBH|nr:N-formylglutamate amidohydrolase [Pseudooceanicola batsensis]EAQ04270.1 N-formylglutamate amidohydrolase family protein [Pseudooceanicola batsensis HTCC2597]